MSASAAAEAGRNLIAADRCFMHQLREWREADEGTPERLVGGIGRRLFWIGWLANGIGALVMVGAIGFLIPIFFELERREEFALDLLPWFVGSFVVAGMVITVLSRRQEEAAFGWIVERREPTHAEHKLTLRLATRSALFGLIAWFAGGIGAFTFTLEYSFGFAIVVMLVVWLAGETTTALVYLLYERTLRPLTALALAVRQPERLEAPGIRDRLLYAWSLGTAVPVFGAVMVGIVGLTKDNVEPDQIATAVVFLGGVALAVGLTATMIAARAISDPVSAVRKALDRVAAGELQTQVLIDDASEVGQLQAGFNRMAEGLREREQIRDLFGRQVGHEVAREALREGTRLGGEEREIGALFVDLSGSTSLSLAMPPTEVVAVLNRFFRVVIEVVESEGGLVNKFEGDAALCVFGAPVECEDPAGQALRAARRLADRLDRQLPEIGFGIGVSAGRAVAGNVGSESRFEYTVIGDAVNEAARLCDLAKQRAENVIASESALHRAAGDEGESWSVTDRTVLRGRLEATGLAIPA